MKPKPLSALNHLTEPTAICLSPRWLITIREPHLMDHASPKGPRRQTGHAAQQSQGVQNCNGITVAVLRRDGRGDHKHVSLIVRARYALWSPRCCPARAAPEPEILRLPAGSRRRMGAARW